MIVYFDTSAFVPLLITETVTPLARELWDSTDLTGQPLERLKTNPPRIRPPEDRPASR
jgi:hypothetical protein